MNFFTQTIPTQNQQIHLPLLKDKEIELWIKREDKIHEFVSGNKFRKLKYNIALAKESKSNTVITFGGAYSNHIVATAVAGNMSNIDTVGIIRGEELANQFDNLLKNNPTIQKAHENGMKFEFISRAQYKEKSSKAFTSYLLNKYPNAYIVPEGGTNDEAIKGCEEILTQQDQNFNYICVPVGTGGTISGLINTAKFNQKIIGFPALKGDFLNDDIQKLTTVKNNWSINTDYHFGGYAKYNSDLIRFINEFYQKTSIALDPVYTSKMLYGIIDMIGKNYFNKGTKILAIHTGGLQGIKGFNSMLQKKNLEIIKVS
ncbi:1-aminocyclopropane-1-carboxylate deaminase/D-cysteine desulfhydrase [Tenacibaculum geojense]|uniref:1-aminocyclopropane-1-carboxylate deaminase/D-cysteine desulfhydrase n=1 Tax=Tenacibaculum geojense TaxID=915352 RepID=A0ABW3JS50_9FLAO